MSECLDDMVQCKLCEEWFHISCEGFKTAPEGASSSALSADRQTLDVFVIVKVLFRIPQQLIIVTIRKWNWVLCNILHFCEDVDINVDLHLKISW